jgi:AraC-like DNA-binding protein
VGLAGRSSRPHKLRKPIPPAITEQIAALRRQRIVGKQISSTVGVSPATVSRVLKNLGLSRLRDLEPAEPIRRYEREHPGELIHIDIKKLGRSGPAAQDETALRPLGHSDLHCRLAP